MKGLSQAVMYLSEDSFRLRSQAYSYFADTFTKALRGRGAFAVWVPKDQGDGDPSANDIAEGRRRSTGGSSRSRTPSATTASS